MKDETTLFLLYLENCEDDALFGEVMEILSKLTLHGI